MTDLVVTDVRRWQGGARRQIAFTEGMIDGTCYVLARTSLGEGRSSVALTKRVPGLGYAREHKVPDTGRFAKRHDAIRAALDAAP